MKISSVGKGPCQVMYWVPLKGFGVSSWLGLLGPIGLIGVAQALWVPQINMEAQRVPSKEDSSLLRGPSPPLHR